MAGLLRIGYVAQMPPSKSLLASVERELRQEADRLTRAADEIRKLDGRKRPGRKPKAVKNKE